jgi:hypothetical protein
VLDEQWEPGESLEYQIDWDGVRGLIGLGVAAAEPAVTKGFPPDSEAPAAPIWKAPVVP